MGSPGTFYRESIKAATKLNRRAVLLMGENLPPENLSQNIIVAKYAPYSQIFPHACEIVHQGGIGTAAQALRSGRPTLIMPYTYDQPDNADRLEHLGTSRTISPKQYCSSRVVKQLRKLLENPKYASEAKEISKIVQADNGVAVACDAIEKQIL